MRKECGIGGCLRHGPSWGSSPQPRPAPDQSGTGTPLVNGWCSNPRSRPARTGHAYLIQVQSSLTCLINEETGQMVSSVQRRIPKSDTLNDQNIWNELANGGKTGFPTVGRAVLRGELFASPSTGIINTDIRFLQFTALWKSSERRKGPEAPRHQGQITPTGVSQGGTASPSRHRVFSA